MPQLDKFALISQVLWFVCIFFFLYFFFVFFVLPRTGAVLKYRNSVSTSSSGEQTSSDFFFVSYLTPLDRLFFNYCLLVRNFSKNFGFSYSFSNSKITKWVSLDSMRLANLFFFVSWKNFAAGRNFLPLFYFILIFFICQIDKKI